MPQDEMLKTALIVYEITAGKLSRNEPVSEEELRKFLGLTGMLNVQMMRQLWTQEELDKQIDERVKSKCASCENTKTIATLAAAAQKPAPAAPESPQNIKTMFATAVAQNMRTLIVMLFITVTVLGTFIIFTRQISEAAEAVTHTTQAVKETTK